MRDASPPVRGKVFGQAFGSIILPGEEAKEVEATRGRWAIEVGYRVSLGGPLDRGRQGGGCEMIGCSVMKVGVARVMHEGLACILSPPREEFLVTKNASRAHYLPLTRTPNVVGPYG